MTSARKLGWLCCLVYFVSYLTRINYGTAIAEIVADLHITKEAAGYAVTGSFITYGAGQIISGMLGDRFKPRRLITFGLLGTTAVNLAMVFLPSIVPMTIVWCFNGLFQALMWPPLVKIMADNMTDEQYTAAVRNTTAAASVATIAIYLIVPAAISLYSWRLAFAFSAVCGLVMAVVWSKGTVGIRESAPTAKADDQAPHLTDAGVWLLLIPIMAAIVLQGFLRDGITTWVPSYITEVYHLGTSVSILTAAVLPLFGIVSISATTYLNKKIGNPLKTAALLFGIGCVSCGAIACIFDKNFIACTVLLALVTACMHGVNLMLIGHLPVYFAKYGKVSTVSGLLNACTYVGSAASTYGFAVFSDAYGWGMTVIGWTIIALAGTVVTAALITRWKRFTAE